LKFENNWYSYYINANHLKQSLCGIQDNELCGTQIQKFERTASLGMVQV